MQKLGDYIKEYSIRNKLDEDIPVYSVTNSNGFCRGYFGKEVASSNKKTYKIVPRNAFTYNPSRINVGSVDYQHCEERVIVSPLYNVFTVDERILPQYLYYYLKNPNTIKRVRTVASGSVRDNLKLSMLAEFPINVPTVAKQRMVIDTLNKLQLVINKKSDEISQLDLLIKARFVEMFGCSDEGRKVNIREVCDMFIDGDWIESRDQSEYGIRLIQTGNIGNGEYKNKSGKMRFISEDTFTRLGCTEVLPGDILISRLPDPVGRACVIPNGIGKMITAVDCTIVRLNKMVLPEYFIAFTNTRTYRRQIETYATGSTRKRISRNNLGNISIPIAPIDKQNQFAAFVHQIDKSKFAVQNTVQDVRG